MLNVQNCEATWQCHYSIAYICYVMKCQMNGSIVAFDGSATSGRCLEIEAFQNGVVAIFMRFVFDVECVRFKNLISAVFARVYANLEALEIVLLESTEGSKLLHSFSLGFKEQR